MKKMLQKGFTLIELLVVITIIGILATGAVTIFTSQIQKARDTTRIGDVKAIQGAVEQSFQDKFSYPTPADLMNTGTGTIKSYMQSKPKDPAAGLPSCADAANGSLNCDYIYATDAATPSGYEISTAFENVNNVTSKSGSGADGGNDNNRFEVGTLKNRSGVTDINSSTGTTTATATGVVIR